MSVPLQVVAHLQHRPEKYSGSPLASTRKLVWCALASLLFVEGQLITDWFDIAALRSNPALWARILEQTQVAFPCGIAITSAYFIFGRHELVNAARSMEAESRGWRAWVFLAGHFVCLALFVGVTAALFGGKPMGPNLAWAVFALWLACGSLSLGLLLLVALPARVWWSLSSRSACALALGIGVGGLAWMTGQSTALGLWHPLGTSTLECAYGLLSLLTGEVVYDPQHFIIGTQSFRVSVGIGCSGYEGIGLTWIFLSVYLWLFRKDLRFPHALLLLPLGTLVVWTTNLIRIVALILIGDKWSPELAIGAFHTRAGWVLFCAVALALIAAAGHSRFFQRSRELDRSSFSQKNPALVWVLPLVLVLGARLGTGPFTADGRGLAGLAMLMGASAIWHFRERYAATVRKPSWLAIGAGVVVFVVWFALAQPGPAREPGQNPLVDSLFNLSRFAGVALVVPIAEELAFRGYLARRLINADFQKVPMGGFTLVSFVATSFLFGLAHEEWLLGIFAGLVYGAVLYRRRNLADAIVAHAVTNALLFFAG